MRHRRLGCRWKPLLSSGLVRPARADSTRRAAWVPGVQGHSTLERSMQVSSRTRWLLGALAAFAASVVVIPTALAGPPVVQPVIVTDSCVRIPGRGGGPEQRVMLEVARRTPTAATPTAATLRESAEMSATPTARRAETPTADPPTPASTPAARPPAATAGTPVATRPTRSVTRRRTAGRPVATRPATPATSQPAETAATPGTTSPVTPHPSRPAPTPARAAATTEATPPRGAAIPVTQTRQAAIPPT